MKFMKRKSYLVFAMLLVALLAISSIQSLNTKKVEASAQKGDDISDVPPRVKNPHSPQAPSGAAPANDNCANAINVTCPAFTDTRSTSGATEEVGEILDTCTLVGATVWYTYTNSAANPVIVTVSTCNSAPLDTTLDVFRVDGAPCDFANFVSVACNDDFCGDGFQSQTSFTADPGATYKIQAGGFDGDTGNLTIDITCEELTCPILTVNGTLGSGSPDHPSTSGLQTPNRIFRDGVPSSCAVPKACPGTFSSGSFNYDAYTFTNESSDPQCVTVNFDPNAGGTPGGVNLHAIAYLGSYVDTDLCINYLADVGSSITQPFSFTVPAGQNFVVVIAANNSGVGVGQTYAFSVVGNFCVGFDLCVQQDFPKRFLEINSSNGDYRYTDCSKNIVREGGGAVSEFFCKINFSGSGPDSSATALLNPCTKKGDATIKLPPASPFGAPQTIKISDPDITNNDCECPQ